MKTYKLYTLFFAVMLVFASCEKESVDYDVQNEGISTELSIRSSVELPTTIQELRDAGVRRQGFTNRQIRNQLPRIHAEYLALVESLQNQQPDPMDDPADEQLPDPGTDPALTQVQQDFVNRFSIPQDVLDELIARNSLDRLIEREQTQLSNPSNLVVLGPNLFEVSVGINQGTGTTRVTRTRAQMEGTFSFQYLFSSGFDTRLQTPNTAATFDRIGREVFQALIDSL